MDDFRTGSGQREPWEQPDREPSRQGNWQSQERNQSQYSPSYYGTGGPFQMPQKKQKTKRLSFFSFFLVVALIASIVGSWSVIYQLQQQVDELAAVVSHIEGKDDGWGDGWGDREEFRVPSIPGTEAMGNPQLILQPSQPGGVALTSTELYKQCADSVVYIRISGGGGSEGSGVMMSRDGYIITNAHVVEGGRRADVTLHDGSKHIATLVGYDWAADLAVLKIDGENFTAAHFADSDGLNIGQRVAAMGSPWGFELKGTMSEGILSGMNRDLYHNGEKAKFLQFDAAVSSGSSGGALIDEYGRVIGIVTMKYVVDMDYESYVENLSFAIPMTEAKAVIDSIIQFGSVQRRPNIGVTLNPLTQQQQEDWGLDYGLLVINVAPDSPAQRADIQKGDILLTADGESLYGTGDLLAVRDEKQYGDMILFTAERDGDTLVLELVFE